VHICRRYFRASERVNRGAMRPRADTRTAAFIVVAEDGAYTRALRRSEEEKDPTCYLCLKLPRRAQRNLAAAKSAERAREERKTKRERKRKLGQGIRRRIRERRIEEKAKERDEQRRTTGQREILGELRAGGGGGRGQGGGRGRQVRSRQS